MNEISKYLALFKFESPLCKARGDIHSNCGYIEDIASAFLDPINARELNSLGHFPTWREVILDDNE